MRNVNDVMNDKLAVEGLDPDQLEPVAWAVLEQLWPDIDKAISVENVSTNTDALRIAAAGLQAYAEVIHCYADALQR